MNRNGPRADPILHVALLSAYDRLWAIGEIRVSPYEGQGTQHNPAPNVAEGLTANIEQALRISPKVRAEFGPHSCTLCLLIAVTAPDRRLHFYPDVGNIPRLSLVWPAILWLVCYSRSACLKATPRGTLPCA